MSHDDDGWVETRPGLLTPLPWRFTRSVLPADEPRVALARNQLFSYLVTHHQPVIERLREWRARLLGPALDDYGTAVTAAARRLGFAERRALLAERPLSDRLDPTRIAELLQRDPGVAQRVAEAAQALATALTAPAIDHEALRLLDELPAVKREWRWLADALVTRCHVLLRPGAVLDAGRHPPEALSL